MKSSSSLDISSSLCVNSFIISVGIVGISAAAIASWPACVLMAKAAQTGGIQDDTPGLTLEEMNTFISRIRR